MAFYRCVSIQKSVLPAGYKQCKYIQGGSASFIQTGINIQIGMEYTADVVLENTLDWHALVGGRTSTTADRYDFIYKGTDSLECYAGTASGSIKLVLESSQRYTITRSQNVFSFINKSTSNEYQSQIKSSTPAEDVDLTLFAQNTKGTITQHSNCKIYSFLVILGNEIKRKFIPALDATGKPCLFDTVTNQPFYNMGTGEFGYELVDGTYVTPI